MATINGNDQRMTKAELLRRYRWVPVVLPVASAACIFVFRTYAKFTVGRFYLSGEQWWLLDDILIPAFRASDFAPIAWLMLTLACSVWTIHNVKSGAELLGKRRALFPWIIAAFIFAVQVLFAALVFGISFGMV